MQIAHLPYPPIPSPANKTKLRIAMVVETYAEDEKLKRIKTK